jgi:hypothetical protein
MMHILTNKINVQRTMTIEMTTRPKITTGIVIIKKIFDFLSRFSF